jgi:exodeoxyribonuclease VIII
MNNAEYHANPAVSNSTLSRFLQSPRLTRTPLKRTPSMRWGTLVHTFLLEPHLVATEWAVMPEGLDKGKGAKERKEQFAIESEGKEVVKHEEYESLVAIRDAVFADEFAGALLSDKGNIVEQSYFWKHEATGYDLRCRPDFIRPDGILGDVKTSASVTPRKFNSSFFDLGYHRQSAMYGDGIEANLGTLPSQTVYVVISGDEAPEIFVQCFAVPAYVIETGRRHYNEGLQKMRAIEDKYGSDPARWPTKLTDGVIDIEQPAYVR